MSKIFGDFENAADLNECALNLLNNDELDDLRILAEENCIDGETLQSFIDRKIQTLVLDETELSPNDNDASQLVPSASAEKPAENPPVNPNETATERLQREIKRAKNQHVPTVPIAKRLETLCESDPVLAAQILLPHKSLEKCFTYVQDKAFKLLQSAGGRGWLDDEETYQMAVDYYNKDDAEEERKKEEDRKKREEESKKRAEEAKKRAAERAATTKDKPGASSTPATTPVTGSKSAAKNAPPADQLSMWGD